MRTVWTLTIRPRIGTQNLASLESCANALTRRATSLPVRRQLEFKDAFTLLLAPVLATALIADTSWKEKRRKDWDAKIAEVFEEVDVLRTRERRVWSSLQHHSVHFGAAQQRRSYATSALALARDEASDDTLEAPEWVEESQAWQTTAIDNVPESEDKASQTLERYRRLVALRMALKIRLHIHTGSSPRFADTDPDPSAFRDGRSQDVGLLINKLGDVNRSLFALRESPAVVLASNPPSPSIKRSLLDDELNKLSNALGGGRLTMVSFAEQLSQQIVQSSEYPSESCYTELLRTVSQLGMDDVSYHIITAIKSGHVYLDARTIYHIFLQYGRKKDAYHFEKFLQFLTRGSPEHKPALRWEWVRDQGTQVPVPVSKHPGILQVLTYAALHCDQPHKAEVWSSIVRENNYGGTFKTYIINNFLRYYSSKADWRRGKAWLHNAQRHAVELGSDNIYRLQRVILAMLNLCVACGKRELYSKIIDAAATSHISVFHADAACVPRFSERSKAIMSEWQDLYSAKLDHDGGPHLNSASAEKFAALLSEDLKWLQSNDQPFAAISPAASDIAQNAVRAEVGVPEFNARWDEMEAEWQLRHDRQQAKINSLSSELAMVKLKHSSLNISHHTAKTTLPRFEQDLTEMRAALLEAHESRQDAWDQRAEMQAEIDSFRKEMHQWKSQIQDQTQRTVMQKMRAELKREYGLDGPQHDIEPLATADDESSAQATQAHIFPEIKLSKKQSVHVTEMPQSETHHGLIPFKHNIPPSTASAKDNVPTKPSPPSLAVGKSDPNPAPSLTIRKVNPTRLRSKIKYRLFNKEQVNKFKLASQESDEHFSANMGMGMAG